MRSGPHELRHVVQCLACLHVVLVGRPSGRVPRILSRLLFLHSRSRAVCNERSCVCMPEAGCGWEHIPAAARALAHWRKAHGDQNATAARPRPAQVLDIYFKDNETVAFSWEEAITIEETGLYYLWFVICDAELSAATVSGATIWKNPTGAPPALRLAPAAPRRPADVLRLPEAGSRRAGSRGGGLHTHASVRARSARTRRALTARAPAAPRRLPARHDAAAHALLRRHGARVPGPGRALGRPVRLALARGVHAAALHLRRHRAGPHGDEHLARPALSPTPAQCSRPPHLRDTPTVSIEALLALLIAPRALQLWCPFGVGL